MVSAADQQTYIRGVAKLNDGKRLVILLDIQEVLPSLDIAAIVAQSSQRRDVRGRACAHAARRWTRSRW